ncbi:MAG: glycosyltransferase [Ktedonobacteraceae bacterium]|nr:glycosyltransferase [Ktedonobacteraceae bacterium]
MNRPARIAFLSEHASPLALLGGVDAGGQNVYVDEVSRNLATQGYLVDIFTRRDHPDLPAIVDWAPGVRVIHVPAGPAEFRLKDDLWPLMPEFCDACQQLMEREEARYDLIHGNFWMSGWVAVELRRRLKIPAVQIFHALGKTKKRHQGRADNSPAERVEVEHYVIREADRLIAQCPAEQRELIDDYGADPRKIVVIPSAVNSEVFRPVSREEARRFVGLDQREFVVVYVGRMLPRKDVRNVVRAMALLVQRSATRRRPALRLLLVGGDTVEPDPLATPEIHVLQMLAAELGISSYVQFVGKRQQDVLRYYYCAGDVVVTTPWYEPFGLTPLEGMACGRPVIGSAVGGIPFTIADGETGFLVPPRDPETLASHLLLLLMHPRLREQMGEQARRRVEQHFSWPTVAQRTARLYEALLAESTAIAPSSPLADSSSSRGGRDYGSR